MTLFDLNAIKFGVFTLAGQKLLENLTGLKKALSGDKRLTMKKYIDDQFNNSFKEFHKVSEPSSVSEGVEILTRHMMGRVGLIQKHNSAAAEVFDKVASDMKSVAGHWCYEDNIEAYHRQGCELARRFYKNSTWTATQDCLCRKAVLVFNYGLPDPDDRDYRMKEDFGYQAASVAYREKSNEIVIRFQKNDDFNLYLAYPFLFLHEYTAHIYSTDFDNFLFSDGWMLHAADVFLWKLRSELDPQALSFEQTGIFRDHLKQKLKDTPLDQYTSALEFETYISGEAMEKFWTITYELAAFEPEQARERFWPSQFLNSLNKEFTTNPELVLLKLKASPDARALYNMLQQP